MLSPKIMRRLAKPMLLSAAMIWGTTFFMMKNALDVIPVNSLLAVRFLGAAAVLGLVCIKKLKLLDWGYVWQGAILGGCYFLGQTIQTFGLELTTPSKNAFLTTIYCVLVPFLSWCIIKIRPDRYNYIAAVLCVAGVGFISLNDAFGVNAGDVLSMISGFFFALQIVMFTKLAFGRDIILLTLVQFASAGVFSTVGVLAVEQFPWQVMLQKEVFWPLAYLCVMATVVALLFQNIGQNWTDAASTAVLLSLEAVFGVIFSVIFYGDPITVRLLAGFALIFLGVICSETKFVFLRKAWAKRSAQKQQEKQEQPSPQK